MPQDYFTFLLRLLANYSCLCYYSELNSTPSPHIHLESQNVTLFGNKVFADKIGYGFQEELTLNLGWILNPMTGVLIKRQEDTETQGRKPHKGRGRDWNFGTTSQGISGTNRSWKRQENFLLFSLQTEQDPTKTSILKFLPPHLWENKFLLFKPPSYNLLQQH